MKNLRKKENPAPQSIPADQVRRFSPDPAKGLDPRQVEERTAQGLVNVVSDDSSQTTGKIVCSNVFTYFNLIFFLLALVLLYEGSFNNLTFLVVVTVNAVIGIIQELKSKRTLDKLKLIFFLLALVLLYEGSFNNLTFLVVVTVNAVIGIIQELKSKRTLDKLKLVSAPESTVIRGGVETKIPSDQLVLDDIVVFCAGNQICADAVVCDGELTVNESLVTGESDEIKKRPGDALLSGSFVVSGNARARLDKVGDDSFAAKLARDAKKIKKKQQPGMIRSLTRLIQIIGIIIIPFAIAMFWNQYHVQGLAEKVSVENTAAAIIGMIPEGLYLQIIGIIIIPFAIAMFWNQYHVQGLAEKVSVENTAAAIIGMIPEGLYLLTSVALAASTIRLAQKDTLVHDMKCIETLARVDMLCVDKTGTITEPQMRLSQIIPLDEDDPGQTNDQVRRFVQSMSADNDTMKALKAHWQGQPTDVSALRIRGFSSRTKYSAADFGESGAFLLGAPEMMLAEMPEWQGQPTDVSALRIRGFSSRTKYSAADFGESGAFLLGAPEMMLAEMPESLRRQIADLSAQGERVLLFAGYEFQPNSPEDIFADGTLGQMVIPLALVTLSNAIRPQAKQTFEYFRSQGVGIGVGIKVISGDNPMTAAAAAEKAGIPGTDRFIDLSTLSSDQEVEQAALSYTVFGRVTPEQKRILVRALKKAGHTVAMTGDGVNDVLALKDADCSIAMASGSEAAAHVSDLVLLNSDFSGMPHVVAEGRRVINNIERSASLFLVKNIFSFVLSVISLVSLSLYPLKPSQISLVSGLMIGAPSFFLAMEPNHDLVHGKFLSVISLVSLSLYPLKPSQISLVSGLMIGAPSFFLAMEPNHDLVHGKFLRNVLFRAFPAALTAVILVEWSLLFTEAFHLPTEMASTMGFFLYAFSAALTAVILVEWSLLFTEAFHLPTEMASTMGFFLYAFSAYLMLYRVCKPMNLWHGLLFGAMGVGFLLAATFIPSWFQIAPLNYQCILILSPLMLLTLPIDHFLHRAFDKMAQWKQATFIPSWFQIAPLNYQCILILSPLMLLTLPIDHFLHRAFDKMAQWKQRAVAYLNEKLPLKKKIDF